MKKNKKISNALILGLVIIIFALVMYVFFKALAYIVEKEKIQSDQIQASLVEKEINTYYTVVPNVYIFKKITDATYSETGLGGVYKNFALTVQCDSNLTLKEKNVIQYVTQAPFGELFYKNGRWYLANISKQFSSKTAVQQYINTCGPVLEKELLKELQIQNALKKKNLETWE